MTRVALFPLDALTPGPGTARDWLREELARRDYQPSLVERFRTAVGDLLDRLSRAASSINGFSPLVAVLVGLVLVAGAVFLLSRLRANPGGGSETRSVFARTRLSAAEHRATALRALDAGDWDEAVVEATRALAAGLFERGLVGEEPGATAHELLGAATRSFPAYADRLEQAAAVFDETRYGDRPADEPRARSVIDLDEQVRAADPRTGVRTGPVAAVPR